MCKIDKSNRDLLILLYIGAPRNKEEIKTFILNIFSDKDAINLHVPTIMQRQIAKLIAKVRLKKIGSIYSSLFGDKSPQVDILHSFKDRLITAYRESYKRELIIKYGMCYTPPYIEDIFEEDSIVAFDRIFLYTLYPHYSYTTTGVCINRFFQKAKQNPFFQHIVLNTYWYNNEKFNELMKNRIVDAANKIHSTVDETVLLFVAHSLPAYTLKRGDIYSQQLEDHVNIILDLLKPQRPLKYYLTYQSRASYGKWLQPYTDNVINELIKEKVKKVIFVPITFITDHIETVYEIDRLYIKKLRDCGIDAIRIDNFNDSFEFVNVFKNMLCKFI